jgi:hypothetical protein
VQKQHMILGAAFAVGCGVTALLLVTLSKSASATHTEARPGAAESTEAVATDQVEIIHLRNELRRRDFALHALAANAQATHEAQPPSGVEKTKAAPNTITAACELLDERMMTAPLDGRRSSELEHAVSTMIDASSVPRAHVASTQCGSTMCKVVLRVEDTKELAADIIALARRTPKAFEGNVVYPSGNNEKAMYFARTRTDLRSSTEEAPVPPPPELVREEVK